MQQQAKPQSLGTGSTNDQGQEKVDVPAQQTKGEFTLPLLFGSLWVLKGFDAAPCTGRGGGSSLFSRQIAVPLSSGNALTDVLRRNVLAVIWASRSPVKVTQGIRRHSPAGKWQSQPPTRTSR